MKSNCFKLFLALLSMLLCICLLLVSCDSDKKKKDDDDDDRKPSTSSTVFDGNSSIGSNGEPTDSSNNATGSTSGDITDSTIGGTTDSTNDATIGSSGDVVDSGDTTDSSEPSDEECMHDFRVTSTVNATCAADGKEISTCSKCGATSERTLTKLNYHSMQYEETEPTCSAEGLVVGTCSVCGYTTETEGKPALGHSGKTLTTEVVTEPTCTEPGKQKQVCSYCGLDQWSAGFKPEIPALGHSYERGDDLFDAEAGVTYVEAQCGIDGYFARVCTDCGFDSDPITREMYKHLEGKANSGYDATVYDEMEGWAHVFSTFVEQTEPTCTEPVYLVYKCKNCDAEEAEPMGKPLGHSYDMSKNGEEGVTFVTNPLPTCVTEGKRVYICTGCGTPLEGGEYVITVPPVEHDTSIQTNEYLVGYVKATCEEAAYRIYKCNKGDCDVVENVYEGEALGHKWARNGEASCKTGGLTPYRCARCKGEKNVEDEFSIALEDAIHSGSMAVEATCSSNAVYLCDVCGGEYGPYEDNPMYADGFAHGRHRMEYYYDVEPTCASVGYKVYKCNHCTLTGKNTNYNKLDTPMAADIIPRVSHSFAVDNGCVTVDAEGNLTCENCSSVYKDVYTEVYVSEGTLCRGCGNVPCTCGVTVETISYALADAIQLLPNNQITVSGVEWSDGSVRGLNIDGGVIAIVGYEGVSYSVTICDSEDNQIMNFFETGETCFIDLYEYDNISYVIIRASSYATVRLCAIVE